MAAAAAGLDLQWLLLVFRWKCARILASKLMQAALVHYRFGYL